MRHSHILGWGQGVWALLACALLSASPAAAGGFQTFADWSSRESIDEFSDEYRYSAITPNAEVLERNMHQPFLMYATTPEVTFMMVETKHLSLLAGSEDVTIKFRIDKGEIFEREGYHVSGTRFNVAGDVTPIVEHMLRGQKVAVRVTSTKSVWTHSFSLRGFTRASEKVRAAAAKSASN